MKPETKARLVRVGQFASLHPGFEPACLRGYILKADHGAPGFEGLRRAIVRPAGRRSVFIDEPLFLEWIDKFRGAPPDTPRSPNGRGGASA